MTVRDRSPRPGWGHPRLWEARWRARPLTAHVSGRSAPAHGRVTVSKETAPAGALAGAAFPFIAPLSETGHDPTNSPINMAGPMSKNGKVSVLIRGIMHLTYRDPLAHTGMVSAPSAETGAPEVEVTEEMIKAGLEEFFSWADEDSDIYDERISAVYIAMERARIVGRRKISASPLR
jgi:hypothetical protein